MTLSNLNFSDAYGFVCDEPSYRRYKNLPSNSEDARTQVCALVYLPLIAQFIGFLRMAIAVCNPENPASYRAGIFIRGFVEFTYVLTPLLILIDLVVTAVRSYQMNQAGQKSNSVEMYN